MRGPSLHCWAPSVVPWTSLDLADLFGIVNRGQLTVNDFERELNSCLLTERGRETYSKTFKKTSERTVEHPQLNRKVSYQYLMRLEAYKLKKHLLTGESYNPFKRWW